jgi:hypothetical protein
MRPGAQYQATPIKPGLVPASAAVKPAAADQQKNNQNYENRTHVRLPSPRVFGIADLAQPKISCLSNVRTLVRFRTVPARAFPAAAIGQNGLLADR